MKNGIAKDIKTCRNNETTSEQSKYVHKKNGRQKNGIQKCILKKKTASFATPFKTSSGSSCFPILKSTFSGICAHAEPHQLKSNPLRDEDDEGLHTGHLESMRTETRIQPCSPHTCHDLRLCPATKQEHDRLFELASYVI